VIKLEEIQAPDIQSKNCYEVNGYFTVEKPFIHDTSSNLDSIESRRSAHQLYLQVATELGLEALIPNAEFTTAETTWGYWLRKTMPYLSNYLTLAEITEQGLWESLPADVLMQLKGIFTICAHMIRTSDCMPDVAYPKSGHYLNFPILRIQRLLKQDALSSRNIGVGIDAAGNYRASLDTDAVFPMSYYRRRRGLNTLVHTLLAQGILDRLIVAQTDC
jgi:hypothetical protein